MPLTSVTLFAQDLSTNLILNLSILHQCFTSSCMSLFYDKDWYQILKPLTDVTNQEIKMLAKFVASDIHFALSDENQCIIELTDEETDFLVCHLAMATASDQLESFCDGFHKPISVMELLLVLENMVTNDKNCLKVVEQPTILPTLNALLLSLDDKGKLLVCKLLVLLVSSTTFDYVWSEDDKVLLIDSLESISSVQNIVLQTLSISLVCFLKKESYQSFVIPLLETIVKLSETISDCLLVDPVKGSSSCEDAIINLCDLLKVAITLSEEFTCSAEFLSVLPNCNITGTLEAIYHLSSIAFNGKFTVLLCQ